MAAATVAWGDEEYATDPEDAPLSSMRRREASEDEDGDSARSDSRTAVGSDAESDGLGGAQVYADEDYDYVAEEEEEEGLEDYYDEEEFEEVRSGGSVEVSPKELQQSLEHEGDEDAIQDGEGNRVDEKGKKDNEPYIVPTAGAFYMHDNRFQDRARGGRRRIFGGRKLWDSKDEHAWVHDRFEEISLQDARHDENNRRFRGRFRGHGGGKNWGVHSGYGRGSKHYEFNDDVNKQKQSPRPVRGRGPRRYEALLKNSRDIPASHQKKSPAKIQEPAINATSNKNSSQAADTKMDPVVSQKHAFSSRLNFASSPFYPSGSSNLNQDIYLTQKRDIQAGNSNKGVTYSVHMGISQSSSLPSGRTVVDPFGHKRLDMNEESHCLGFGKSMKNKHLQPSGFSFAPDTAATSSSIKAPSNNQHVYSANQVGRVSARIQSPFGAATTSQPVVRVPAQQSVQHCSTGNQIPSPPVPEPSRPSANSSEFGETDSPPGSSESRTSLAGKGRINNQGTFIYNGTHVLGSNATVGFSQGDKNFPRTPALFPVMQFGGEHPGGVGVPAVGMAVPGYVAQQQFGSGNPEITWIPVLAGMPGTLGAAYCPPYIALDGNNYSRPSGQTLSSVSSKEASTNKPETPTSQSDSVVDDVGCRQNKPRRYSEMNFGQ